MSFLFRAKWIIPFFLFIAIFVHAKLPHLQPREVKKKIEEILKVHVSHKGLNAELMERIFQNFLDELDPAKTYFIASDIQDWVHPDEESIARALEGFQHYDYASFYEIHAIFLSAVQRRNFLEKQMAEQEMPSGVASEEFKELPWADSVEELEKRLLRMKSLQVDAASKMGEESRNRFLQVLEKRRLTREAELAVLLGDEQTNVVLTMLLKATTAALDAHTNYFTPSEANQFMIQVQQRLFGVGAQLRDDLDGLTVVRILENSPALQSGKLKINDKIIAVNHEPIVGLDIAEAVELIRGEKGTPVLLSILRDSKTEEGKKSELLEIELIRNEIVLEDSRLESQVEPYGDGSIAILRLFSFYQDTQFSSAQDLKKALEKIKKESSLKGVILDLRNNAGGLLTQAVAVTGLFINNGIVVSIKDETGKVQHLREVNGNPIWEGPLVVLVNRASASAAEIVAQSLQDYGRALVVGDAHTFGKGSFQTFTLDAVNNPKVNPQGEYKVTRGKYYTVSGKSPQLEGVLSDIVVPGLLSQIDIGEKFAKFPLKNDAIEPHFDDDLADISAFYRLQLGASYRQNLQPLLSTYLPYIALLKKNAEYRVKENKNYQAFLAEIEKKNFDSSAVDLFHQCDLQLQETVNIMKDLLILMRETKRLQAAG